MIAVFREAWPHSFFTNTDVSGGMTVRFAEALRYEGCTQELKILCPDITYQVVYDEISNLARKLYTFTTKFDIDVDVFGRCFKGILKMDVDCGSFAGWISLNEAFRMGIQLEKLKVLFDIGCDINSCDKDGSTPFVYICEKLSKVVITEDNTKSFFDLVNNVKVCLQQNPSVQLTKDVAQSIVVFESKLSTYTDYSKADLTAYSLLTAFHMHGYDFSSCQLDQSDTVTRHNVAKLARCTRSLKETCRIVLRKHYTGRSIHTYVHTVAMPILMKQYILMKDVLVC